MENSKPTILYLDDESANLRIFKMAFRSKFKIFTAEKYEEAVDILQTETVAVIISDQKMPQMTGVDFFNKIVDKFPNPARIILSGYSDSEAITQAVNSCGIYRFITKPWDKESLLPVLDDAVSFHQKIIQREETEVRSQKKIEELTAELSALKASM